MRSFMPLPFHKKPNENKHPGNFWLIVIAAIIAIALLLRLYQWIFPASSPSLLSDSKSAIQLSELDDISKYLDWSGPIPSQTFGSELYVIGVYLSGSASFPKNTVALVYTKDNYRFVEISYQPNKTINDARAAFANFITQEVELTDSINGLLVDIRKKSYCHTPREDEIGICQITKELFFEKDGMLIVVSADGKHASDGELIEIARSMID